MVFDLDNSKPASYIRMRESFWKLTETAGIVTAAKDSNLKAGDRDRTGDVQLGKLAFYR